MTFDQARQEKFDKGHKEHKQPWDLDHINHIAEIQDEICDLYNYASLDPNDSDMHYLMVFAKKTWEQLEKKKPKEPAVCIACEG